MTSQLKVDRISPATGSEIIIDGFGGGGGGPSAVKIIDSSGKWTNPGVSKIAVEMWGAGSSGSQHSSEVGYHCGRTGGYGIVFLDVSSISEADIIIGAGGPGVSNEWGRDAGDTTWDDGVNFLKIEGATKDKDAKPFVDPVGFDHYILGANTSIQNVNVGVFTGHYGDPVYAQLLGARLPGVGSRGHHKAAGTSHAGGPGKVIITEY
jgi:hypothetical protein